MSKSAPDDFILRSLYFVSDVLELAGLDIQSYPAKFWANWRHWSGIWMPVGQCGTSWLDFLWNRVYIFLDQFLVNLVTRFIRDGSGKWAKDLWSENENHIRIFCNDYHRLFGTLKYIEYLVSVSSYQFPSHKSWLRFGHHPMGYIISGINPCSIPLTPSHLTTNIL